MSYLITLAPKKNSYKGTTFSAPFCNKSTVYLSIQSSYCHQKCCAVHIQKNDITVIYNSFTLNDSRVKKSYVQCRGCICQINSSFSIIGKLSVNSVNLMPKMAVKRIQFKDLFSFKSSALTITL